MIVFETKRLLVRYLQDDDFDAFYSLCSDPEVMRYMGDGKPLTAELTRGWIKTSQENYQKQGFGCFALTSRQDAQLLGFGGLIYPHGSSQVEIIYAFKPSYWGRGLASEFVRAMIKTGFERWQLPRIEASIDPRNPASIKVVQRIGMVFVRSGVDETNQPTLFYALNRPPR
jgi:RimJ/RimL family protein N-acetyltransferase